jgi:hypothetical protein
MDFCMNPYMKENEIVSERRSLYQELLDIIPSTQRLNLQAKAGPGAVVGDANPFPMEPMIQRFFGI